jgi:uncharacterized membrane protein YesL
MRETDNFELHIFWINLFWILITTAGMIVLGILLNFLGLAVGLHNIQT